MASATKKISDLTQRRERRNSELEELERQSGEISRKIARLQAGQAAVRADKEDAQHDVRELDKELRQAMCQLDELKRETTES